MKQAETRFAEYKAAQADGASDEQIAQLGAIAQAEDNFRDEVESKLQRIERACRDIREALDDESRDATNTADRVLDEMDTMVRAMGTRWITRYAMQIAIAESKLES